MELYKLAPGASKSVIEFHAMELANPPPEGVSEGRYTPV